MVSAKESVVNIEKLSNDEANVSDDDSFCPDDDNSIELEIVEEVSLDFNRELSDPRQFDLDQDQHTDQGQGRVQLHSMMKSHLVQPSSSAESGDLLCNESDNFLHSIEKMGMMTVSEIQSAQDKKKK